MKYTFNNGIFDKPSVDLSLFFPNSKISIFKCPSNSFAVVISFSIKFNLLNLFNQIVSRDLILFVDKFKYYKYGNTSES